MIRRIRGQQLQWRRLDEGVERRIDAAVRSWVGTPYGRGATHRVAANCIGLIFGIYDELFRVPLPTPYVDLPPTSRLADANASYQVVRCVMESYHGIDRHDPLVFEPGDICVMRDRPNSPTLHNPGHAMILTATPWVALHTTHGRGCAFLTDLFAYGPILDIYRARERDLWR